ncbi:MAG: DUF523 domain-containing protein [Erysipelotrichia bacterium]|nr:DUF523 domain-containing protein [Erysipelotrichia bacterium]
MRNVSRILVSACLAGVKCNYKAAASSDYQERLLLWERIFSEFVVFPVCPEQLGGLPTPRIPAELVGSAENIISGDGLVVNKAGLDVTANFIKGAKETLRLAKMLRVDCAVLKSKSPSCGKNSVYDGTFSGVLIPGSGLSARMLVENGFRVFDEQEFLEHCQCTFAGSFSGT